MADKIKKAHGHIIQADWNQTDPLQMDYIHNKPEKLVSEDFVLEKCRENVLRYDVETDAELNTVLATTIQNFQDKLFPGDHLIIRQFHAGQENRDIYRDHVYILVQESPRVPPIWQKIVEDKTKRIVNKAGGKYTESFTLGELTFRASSFWGSDTLTPTAWVGALPAAVTLPNNTDENTVYTIRTINAKSTTLVHGEMSLGIQALPESWNTCESFSCGCTWCKEHALFTATSYSSTASISTNTLTHTGPWEVIFGESSGGMSYTEWQTDFNKFKDVIVEYSYENYEGDDEAKGPVHSIDLHSDRELHYDYPVTELTINSLHKCYDDSIAQDWVVSFVAGDIDPIVVVPESVNNKPVKWINGKPQFRSNKKYMLIFKEITGTIYIETKLLSEDKTCDQWILCPYDYESESATYGDLTLQNLTLMELVEKLQENEMFEIIGGKTTFVAAPYVHPDYGAAQGNITIPNAPNMHISNCISLKIWKIRKPTSTTELEVHILGTFIPSSGDKLPDTLLCTDSVFYMVLSEYLAKCITGGGVDGHSLIKYSNIL